MTRRESKYRAPERANLPPTHEVPESLDLAEICRRVISDPSSTAIDKFRAMDRLREIERERGREERLPEPQDVARSYADDPEAFSRLIGLCVEYGFFDEIPAFKE